MTSNSEIDALAIKAALAYRCWTCDRPPGCGCTSDFGDEGIIPCHPHPDRLIAGYRDVIRQLLVKP